MEFEAAKTAVRYCIQELRTRFMISQDNFVVKCVDKVGRG
jgi:hypothetical protein